MTNPIDLSIIIPAYREAACIGTTLERLAHFLDTREFGEIEVLVVVADSPDGTAEIAASKSHLFERFRVVHAGPRVGKGRDVRLGIIESRGNYKVFMDADLATPLEHLDEIHAGILRGETVMIGVRNLAHIHSSFLRKMVSILGNWVARFLLTPGIHDTQCGFKAFQARAAEAIFSRQTMMGWSFDVEILKITTLLGYKIHTIEIPDWFDPKVDAHGLAGDSPVRAALRTFIDLVVIRGRVWRGCYRLPNKAYKDECCIQF